MNKKKIIIIAVIVAVLAASYTCVRLWAHNLYNNIDASKVPVVAIEVGGHSLHPISASIDVTVFDESLFGGTLYNNPKLANAVSTFLGIKPVKTLNCMFSDSEWHVIPEGAVFDMENPITPLGTLGQAPFTLETNLNDSLSWSTNLSFIGAEGNAISVYSKGSLGKNPATEVVSDYVSTTTEKIIIQRVGDYEIALEGALNEGSEIKDISGTFFYNASFDIESPPPLFTEGRTELQQGDILSLRLENVLEGVVPEIETKLGPAIFTQGLPREEGSDEERISLEGLSDWFGIVPINNSRAPGNYPVTVRAGDLEYEIVVTVTEYNFDFQNMIIDTSIPSVADATSAGAAAEFREKVWALMPLMSEERFWNGHFIVPVEMGKGDFISTQFGEIRITNGEQNTRRSHYGMDFAVSTGTPVHASNSGKVLVSEFLRNTGNTVVLDHGGGLKSFYYHMHTVEDLAGQVIDKGTLIGTVGTTGYSTGPHLHFEMRIGEQAISPSMLFDPAAGLYSAK